MKNLLATLLILASAFMLIAMPVGAEQADAPVVKLVKGPDKPIGPHANAAGVQELFRINKTEAEGKLEEADAAYTKYIEKYKDQPVAVYHHAALKLAMNDPNTAADLIRKAESIRPG